MHVVLHLYTLADISEKYFSMTSSVVSVGVGVMCDVLGVTRGRCQLIIAADGAGVRPVSG